jgi:predicted  nucleic acid-binding Zn-ribbon protein
MDDEAKPYLLTEASGLTGLSVDALRKRIERKGLRGSRSNEDKQWRVWLTSRDIEAAKAGRSMDKSSHGMDILTDEAGTIKVLESELRTVREALDRERERADWDASRAGEAERRLEEERTRAAIEVKTLREEREEARIRAARLEGELEAMRRPFWRRWIG